MAMPETHAPGVTDERKETTEERRTREDWSGPLAHLMPMPAGPSSSGLVAAVQYLVPVARGIWTRHQAQRTLKSQLHDDQRLLDGVLRDLGRAAREQELSVPVLADEMARVRDQEQRRARLETERAQAEAAREQERHSFAAEEAASQRELDRLQAELAAAEQELAHKQEERRAHVVEWGQLEGRIREAERLATQAEARAVKAESTPGIENGDEMAAQARAQVEQAASEAKSLQPASAAAKAKAEALDGPIATLASKVGEHRTDLDQRRHDRSRAAREHERAVADVEEQQQQAEARRGEVEQEISQLFVSMGTLLNLNRIEGPRFAPLYARVDELKSSLSAREEAIVRLESERRAYDRTAVQKGLLVLGGAAGLLVLLVIVLLVLLAR